MLLMEKELENQSVPKSWLLKRFYCSIIQNLIHICSGLICFFLFIITFHLRYNYHKNSSVINLKHKILKLTLFMNTKNIKIIIKRRL